VSTRTSTSMLGVGLVTSLLLAGATHAAPIALDGPTTDWIAMNNFGTTGDPDDAANPEAELIGDASHSAVYYQLDDNGAAANDDGTLYFRMRIGHDNGGPGFKAMAVIGIDGDLSGSVDALVIADFNPPGADSVQVRQVSGTGLSPATTNISSLGYDVAATAANTNWTTVNAGTDPTATNTDLNADGTDYFISFSVDFATVVQIMNDLGIGGFNDQTLVNFVAGTSTNASSSMNQDIAGVNGQVGSATSWALLGGSAGPIVVPEPHTGALLACGLLALAWRRRTTR
jgi:hypothetical protein